MAFRIVHPAELDWITRPHEADEPTRHVAELSELLGCAHTRANVWRYEPGAVGRRHRHPLQAETFVVLAGELSIYLGEPPERHDVPSGGVVHVEPGTALQSANHGEADLLVYAYGTPPEREHAEILDPAVQPTVTLPGMSDESLFGEEHIRRYRETGGEVGHRWRGVHTLLLTTSGRRSGEPRTAPLIYGRDGDRYVVVASKGGAPRHPAWYVNLSADPAVELQVGPDVFPARARAAEPGERERLWRLMAEVWPAYDDYAAKTDREIPVVVLEPA